MLRWIIFIAIYIAIDIYAFQALRTLTRTNWIHWLYVVVSVTVLGAFIYQITTGPSRVMNPARMYTFGLFIAVFLPKFLLVAFMFGEDVYRVIAASVSKIGGSDKGFFIPSRRKFISGVAVALAAIPFSSLLFGMVRGKYNYKVLKYTLEYDDLPEAFDGYTLTQISDVHSGSFDNKDKINYGINLINEQASDLIVFTGDLVNDAAEEMMPWKDLFGQLKAKDGVYSVLGNHDYGDYRQWESQAAKEKNMQDLKDLQKEMGWLDSMYSSHIHYKYTLL